MKQLEIISEQSNFHASRSFIGMLHFICPLTWTKFMNFGNCLRAFESLLLEAFVSQKQQCKERPGSILHFKFTRDFRIFSEKNTTFFGVDWDEQKPLQSIIQKQIVHCDLKWLFGGAKRCVGNCDLEKWHFHKDLEKTLTFCSSSVNRDGPQCVVNNKKRDQRKEVLRLISFCLN